MNSKKERKKERKKARNLCISQVQIAILEKAIFLSVRLGEKHTDSLVSNRAREGKENVEDMDPPPPRLRLISRGEQTEIMSTFFSFIFNFFFLSFFLFFVYYKKDLKKTNN